MLALALALFLIALFGISLILSTSDLGSENLTVANFIVYGFLVLLFALALYSLSTFMKSKKIEFFQDHVKIFLGGKDGTRDVSYKNVRLGPLKIRNIRGYVYLHFELSLNKDDRSFDVRNTNLRTERTSLYSWLERKVS
jgi:hypothetical protein